MQSEIKLKRSISLPALVLYGLGTMVGCGFYALLGKVAAYSGVYLPFSLAFSGLIALVNGLSFAELASRFPVSAGESKYVWEGFKLRLLSQIVGVMVVITGVVSAATLSVATIGFLADMVVIPEPLSIVVLVLILGGVAVYGVSESVILVGIITFIEVATLFFIFFLNYHNLDSLPVVWQQGSSFSSPGVLSGLLSGAFLGFYAFIGFEDMVNMAEEVKDPKKTLALAIPITVVLTTVLYMAVSIVAVCSTPMSALIESRTPMAVLVGDLGAVGVIGIGVISMLTGINGALVQIIMASRVSYGLAKQGQAPKWLASVSAYTQTPYLATALVTVIILALALFFPLETLAKSASGIILIVFSLVNLSLFKIKAKPEELYAKGPRFPRWVPLLGFFLCFGMLLFQLVATLGY